ncbi:MAG: hypothetical protein IJ485_07865 [Lachnospiraceae bacterium]|nr:hypothetical protein [Lachnospiraceae bacterium]
MSYCVNCGVELEASHTSCPLCNTPVLNPKQLSLTQSVPPFPKEKGQVEVVKRKDLAILLSVVLLSTAITCGLLNLLVYNESLWSLVIIGACVVIWVFMIPLVIYTKLPIYVSILFDGIVLAIYLFMITGLTTNNSWYFHIAMPIIMLLTFLAECMALLLRKFRASFLFTATISFAELAILCTGIELFINMHLSGNAYLTWSAIVLTICIIIVITLITMLSKKRLRNAVRRRLHF